MKGKGGGEHEEDFRGLSGGWVVTAAAVYSKRPAYAKIKTLIRRASRREDGTSDHLRLRNFSRWEPRRPRRSGRGFTRIQANQRRAIQSKPKEKIKKIKSTAKKQTGGQKRAKQQSQAERQSQKQAKPKPKPKPEPKLRPKAKVKSNAKQKIQESKKPSNSL